jgi:uncharacterized protein YjgD (DUF1641 family)
MAIPLTFKPNPADPHVDLEHRLKAAPREHAEALLVLYDTLQAAHDNGMLDAVHGAVVARDTIFGEITRFANAPEGKAGLLNLLTTAKLFASLDPEILSRLSRASTEAAEQHKQERTPPSLWQLFKRASSEDGRRGLSFVTLLLTSAGRALKS